MLTYDNLLHLKYLSHCIYETLRIDPSVPISSPFMFTEPVQIGGYTIRDDHYCQINIYGLHHNPAEWQRPEEFLPERWDSDNPLSLTPNGTKRHPMSYGPFLGGRRVCLGKTFSETAIKVIISMVLQLYTIELHDKDHYVNKPFIAGTPRDPPTYIDVKKRHYDYS
mmetsp:Transcript_30470/g.29850  ORF Transcript_30470/g.29850 Transcript_30470/m.29850 type:complete len:166 (+) Transcript_30470:300-797(+)